MSWFQNGAAQSALMNADEKPRHSMIGVVGRYSYEVKSECSIANTRYYEVADFLLEVTKGDTPP